MILNRFDTDARVSMPHASISLGCAQHGAETCPSLPSVFLYLILRCIDIFRVVMETMTGTVLGLVYQPLIVEDLQWEVDLV